MDWLPESARLLLPEQLHLLRRDQLVGPGLLRADQLDGRVQRGQVDVPQHRIYRFAGSLVVPEQELLACVMRCGEGAVAGGESACWLHRLAGFEDPPERWTVCSPRAVTGVDFRVVRTAVRSTDRGKARGVPAARVERALAGVSSKVDGQFTPTRSSVSPSTTRSAAG